MHAIAAIVVSDVRQIPDIMMVEYKVILVQEFPAIQRNMEK